MHASVNVGWQGKCGPGKIHKVLLVPKNKVTFVAILVDRYPA